MSDTAALTIGDYMRGGDSATIGVITDLDEPARDIKLRIVTDSYASELKVQFALKLPNGKTKTQQLYFGGVHRGANAAELAQHVEEYLNTDIPKESKGWKVELLPLKAPKVKKPKAPAETGVLAEQKQKLQQLEKQRFKTWPQEQQIKHIRLILAADPAKWTVGMGVGWRVTRDQINRGFRIVAVIPEEKRAEIVQVADTGLTRTGGDDPLTGDTHLVWLADLLRDKKYDAPPTTQGPPPVPAPAPDYDDYEGIVTRLRAPAERAPILPGSSTPSEGEIPPLPDLLRQWRMDRVPEDDPVDRGQMANRTRTLLRWMNSERIGSSGQMAMIDAAIITIGKCFRRRIEEEGLRELSASDQRRRDGGGDQEPGYLHWLQHGLELLRTASRKLRHAIEQGLRWPEAGFVPESEQPRPPEGTPRPSDGRWAIHVLLRDDPPRSAESRHLLELHQNVVFTVEAMSGTWMYRFKHFSQTLHHLLQFSYELCREPSPEAMKERWWRTLHTHYAFVPRAGTTGGPTSGEEYRQLVEYLQHPPSRQLPVASERERLRASSTPEVESVPAPTAAVFPSTPPSTTGNLTDRLADFVQHAIPAEQQFRWIAADSAVRLVWPILVDEIYRVAELHPHDPPHETRPTRRAGMGGEEAEAFNAILTRLRRPGEGSIAKGDWTNETQYQLEGIIRHAGPIGVPESLLHLRARGALWAGETIVRRDTLQTDDRGEGVAWVLRAAIAAVAGEQYRRAPLGGLRPPGTAEIEVPAARRDETLRRVQQFLRDWWALYRARVAMSPVIFTFEHIGRLGRRVSREEAACLAAAAARKVRGMRPPGGGYVVSQILTPRETEQVYEAVDAWLDRRDPRPGAKLDWTCNLVREFKDHEWDPRMWVALSAGCLISEVSRRIDSSFPIGPILYFALRAALRAAVTQERHLDPLVRDRDRQSWGGRALSPDELAWVRALWVEAAQVCPSLEAARKAPHGPATPLTADGPPPVAGPGIPPGMFEPAPLPEGKDRNRLSRDEMIRAVNLLLEGKPAGSGRWQTGPEGMDWPIPLLKMPDVLTDRAIIEGEIAALELVADLVPELEFLEGPLSAFANLYQLWMVADHRPRAQVVRYFRDEANKLHALTDYFLGDEHPPHSARLMHASARIATDMAHLLEGKTPEALMDVVQDTMVGAQLAGRFDSTEQFLDAWWSKLQERLDPWSTTLQGPRV